MEEKAPDHPSDPPCAWYHNRACPVDGVCTARKHLAARLHYGSWSTAARAPCRSASSGVCAPRSAPGHKALWAPRHRTGGALRCSRSRRLLAAALFPSTREHHPGGGVLRHGRHASPAAGHERGVGGAHIVAPAEARCTWRTGGVARGACARGGRRGPTAAAPAPGNPAPGPGQDHAPPPGLAQSPGRAADAPEPVACTTGGVAALGGRADAAWLAPTGAAGVRPSPVAAPPECGVRSRAASGAAHRAGGQPRAGPAVEAPARPRQQGVLGGSAGIFWRARGEASSRGRRLSGRHTDPGSPRRECPGTRDHHVGEPARALEDHGVGREWGTGATGEGGAWRGEGALWGRWHACAASREGGGGAYIPHCPVALPGDWGVPSGGSTPRGVSGLAGRHAASALVRVEAARCPAGPCTAAVGEMGAPPTGLPARVARRRAQRGTGVCPRTESRAVETRGPHATGSRQTARGHGPPR
jgi:hypothetical protein